jgi:hypothetical protein
MGDLRSAAWPRGRAFVLIAALCITLFPDGLSSGQLRRIELLSSIGGRLNSGVSARSGNSSEIRAAILIAGNPIGSARDKRAHR